MPILAIDYGEKHLGFAFSPDGKVSCQLSAASCQSDSEKVEKVKRICEEYGVTQIVIGLPLDQEGKASKQAEKVKRFGGKLAEEVGAPVYYWNETLSSSDALQKMIAAGVPKEKRKKLEHSFAAQIVLQEFLDVKCKPTVNLES